ncbi:hypothetical protein HZA76_00435 [Candidatus Roizmanbacteria bacterium]|nr:hypothetical protein [Candidatus Roizmanbacteria bacterium]
MDKLLSPLKDKSLLIIFAYAPAGLGHLRVTDALYHGLPKEVGTPLLLGSQDTTITYLHRFMSINPIIRHLTVWLETGLAEDVTTVIYRYFLRTRTEVLYKQMLTLINEIYTPPTKVLVIATHFGLAHQLASLKDKLEKDTNIKMILVVQVTDDSPHHIWYVPGADLIVVPSNKTKAGLLEYGKDIGSNVKIEVNPYPLSPRLNKTLTENQIEEKFFQVDPSKNTRIQVLIPISGAAVGTYFFTKLIPLLHEKSDRFVFHVVAKDAPFTKNFVGKISDLSFVHLYTAADDRKIITNYDYVYEQNVVSLEITKPSEQSFKALFDCNKHSASLLLFTEPVGRQEYDNLDFLRRHKLIPSKSEEKTLWQMEKIPNMQTKAQFWRGISLPKGSIKAANFIYWCLEQGIFTSMMNCKIRPLNEDEQRHELNSNGVASFWQTVAKLL